MHHIIVLVMAFLLGSTGAKILRSGYTAFGSYHHHQPIRALSLSSHQNDSKHAAHSSLVSRPHHMNSTMFGRRCTNYCSRNFGSALQLGDTKLAEDDDGASSTPGDAQPEKKKRKSGKQRRAASKKKNLQRIDKVLAHRGVGTRSETFELAKARRITVASSPDAPHEERTRLKGPKEKVPYDASLFMDGNLLPGPPPLLMLYHKPKYVLSVMRDSKKYEDQGRKHLGQVLEPRLAKAGMHPVGRLDYDTTGLILFSMDGGLTQQLLHPRRGVEKEYVATVQGMADEAKLSKQLADGVATTEGVHRAELIAVIPSEGSNDPPSLEELSGISEENEDIDDSEVLGDFSEIGEEDDLEMQNDYEGPYSDVRLVVSEGKHRMVRRMLANCGHPVVELKRLRHGSVELGSLGVGEFRDATDAEVEWARSLIK